MAKDKSNRSRTKESRSDETMDPVETKKQRKEKKSKKRKTEEDVEQEVPEVVVKHKKQKKHKKKRSKDTTTHNNEEEEEEGQQETTESPDPAVTLEQDSGGEEEGAGGEELSAEEQRVLQRKLKKLRKKEEKAKLREEGKTVAKAVPERPLPAQQALDYLTCWNENRTAWKFQKLRQTWLLQQMFDSEKLPDENFPALLLYIEGLRGTAKDTTVEKAEALVKSLGDGPWDKEQEGTMRRAREVIQLLS